MKRNNLLKLCESISEIYVYARAFVTVKELSLGEYSISTVHWASPIIDSYMTGHDGTLIDYIKDLKPDVNQEGPYLLDVVFEITDSSEIGKNYLKGVASHYSHQPNSALSESDTIEVFPPDRPSRNGRRMGLINYEGDCIYVEITRRGQILIKDQWGVVLDEGRRAVVEFISGTINITDSRGKEWNYLSESKDAKPETIKLADFLDSAIPRIKKEQDPIDPQYEKSLERRKDMQYVKAKMRDEGLAYCFLHYSDFNEVKDTEFHRIRKELIKSIKSMEHYVNNTIEHLNKIYE